MPMKKFYYVVCMSVLCLLLGCRNTSDVEKDEKSLNAVKSVSESIGEDVVDEEKETDDTVNDNEATDSVTTEESGKEYSEELLPRERESIVMGKLSPEHIYYDEVTSLDPACADYIQELTIYDEEINDTFVVHISLPPNYDESKEYPLIVMTDGVWRLSDHPELRPLMISGEIEDIIMVSIGYPNDYDYEEIRVRDLVEDPESYLHFIVDNLIPYLSEIYSVSSENMTLTGHSYGGFWAFYALFNSDTIGKNMFQNYYIGSPSFQASSNHKFIEDFEEEYYERNKELNCNVYITVGGDEQDVFRYCIDYFVADLQKKNYEGLQLTYETIEGYGHDTVFKPSIKNTLLKFYQK